MSCILKLNINYTEIWMYHHIDKLEKLQYSALRLGFNDFTSSYDDLLTKANMPTLHISRIRTIQRLLRSFSCFLFYIYIYFYNLFFQVWKSLWWAKSSYQSLRGGYVSLWGRSALEESPKLYQSYWWVRWVCEAGSDLVWNLMVPYVNLVCNSLIFFPLLFFSLLFWKF